MKNNVLRRKFVEMIATIMEEFRLTPIYGWIEGILRLENKDLTQREISDKLSEILKDDHYATSLTSVNRALNSMENENLIIRKGSRRVGYRYSFNKVSGTLIGLFENLLSKNTKLNQNLQIFKKQVLETNDKSLLNGIEIELTYSQTLMKFYQKILDEIKENQ